VYLLAAAGVDAVVLTLPYYAWPHLEENSLAFFSTIAATSPLPVVAYNLPKAVGYRLSSDFLQRLWEIPNLVCIKDTHDEGDEMRAVASSARPTGCTYLPGNSALTIDLLRHGADGVVSTPANIMPEVFVEIMRLHAANEPAELERLEREVLPDVVSLLGLMPTGAAALKGLLALDGYCQPTTMAPWPEMSPARQVEARERLAIARAAFRRFKSRVVTAA
jgi:4-hydroxy-tetrahydrodipicolinate synthase